MYIELMDKQNWWTETIYDFGCHNVLKYLNMFDISETSPVFMSIPKSKTVFIHL